MTVCLWGQSQTEFTVQTVGKGNAVFLIEVHDGYYKQEYRQNASVLYRKDCSRCKYILQTRKSSLCWPARMTRNQSCHFFIQIYLTWGPSWPRVFPSIQSLSLLFIATQITDWFEEICHSLVFTRDTRTIGTEIRAQVRPTCSIFETKGATDGISGQPQSSLGKISWAKILNYDGRNCMPGHVNYLVWYVQRK